MYIPVPTIEEELTFDDRERKSYETRLRRTAARRGMKLERSRRRDMWAVGAGKYRLTDVATGEIISTPGKKWPSVERAKAKGLDLSEFMKGYHYTLRTVAIELNRRAGS